MKCCAGCFVMFMALFVISVVIQAVSATWPMILGLTLSWMSLRYIKAFSTYDEEDG